MHIETDDLEKLRNIHREYSDIRSNISDTAIMIERFKSQQTRLIQSLAACEEDLMAIQKEVSTKYNASGINIETGEYTVKADSFTSNP